MRQLQPTKWTSHPGFFWLVFFIGTFALSFSFETTETHYEFQLSSVAAKRDVASVADRELIAQLEKSKLRWSSPSNRDYTITPAQVEQLDLRATKQIPKRFKDNPVFKLLEKITEDVTSVQYEDPLACDKKRQYYESQMSKIPNLRALTEAREAKDFPQSCVIQSMNHFQVPKNNFAFCSKQNSQVQIPGVKPCVTPNLVNLTYNIFMDITECLNLNPKWLLPKIDFESGFFLNAYGSDKEGGVGQLTRPAINEVNFVYNQYIFEIEKSASPACARVQKLKPYLGLVPSLPEQRCTLMALPENPARNIFYLAVFNRIIQDKLTGDAGLVKALNLEAKLAQAGLKNPDMNFFKQMLALAGYNAGVQTVANQLSSFLQKRIDAGIMVLPEEFDFNNTAEVIDIDGEKRNVVAIARLNVMSAFVDPADKPETKALKLQRRKQLKQLWQDSFNRTFPEFLAYNSNSYNGNDSEPFVVYGFPGYVNAVAARNKSIRTLLENIDYDANLCTDPDFLKMKPGGN